MMSVKNAIWVKYFSKLKGKKMKKEDYMDTALCGDCQHKNICGMKWYIIGCSLFELEEQKMNDNYFVLDGKRIPMSEKTAESLREKNTKVPMVRRAICNGESRIIIRITKGMRRSIIKYPMLDIFAFDKKGHLYHWYASKYDEAGVGIYDNIETLFEGDLE